MNKRYKKIFQAVIILLLLAFAAWRAFGPNPNQPPSGQCDFTERYAPTELVYVSHAKCRMRCRDIDKKLVEKVYLLGEVNCKKSSVKNGKHRYALEKRDDRGDIIRLIIEENNDQHVVITAIRLDRADKCSCS